VSINTYKFNSLRHLHASKQEVQERIVRSICRIRPLAEIAPEWPIELYGDHMGPAGYDSQLFLASFKNWMIASNVLSATAALGAADHKTAPITKAADLSSVPHSELALVFPFGIFRRIETRDEGKTEAAAKRKPPAPRKSRARKRRPHDSTSDSESEEGSEPWIIAIFPTLTFIIFRFCIAPKNAASPSIFFVVLSNLFS
jgi:hypothetical protein